MRFRRIKVTETERLKTASSKTLAHKTKWSFCSHELFIPSHLYSHDPL
jgi:hypothetical protein